MPNLALFDFDGTTTTIDTFTKFIFYVTPKRKRHLAKLRLLPLMIGYKLKWVSNTTARQKVVQTLFKGKSEAEIFAKGADYATNVLPHVLRPQAMARMAWHKAQGDTVVLVSASLEPYLKPWCESQGIELLCAKLASKNGILTGKYLGTDCAGEHKATKVKQAYRLTDYDSIYAYGDTHEDNAMMALADHAYYRHFDFE